MEYLSTGRLYNKYNFLVKQREKRREWLTCDLKRHKNYTHTYILEMHSEITPRRDWGNT